ncbi:MAG: hypothetical protein LN414_01315 [Candidatus Thermoplasmatota archaeon]|nr:hypothetical protein [Candidatus Thermoplasmatota archaeon]
MRRYLHLRDRRSALVAIYDALLFLMVAILIAEGMFLYSATTVQEGGDFSDDAYQRVCDNQRIMVEGLLTNETLTTPQIGWSNGTASDSQPLNNITDSTEVETVGWLLESYCNLTWRNGEGQEIYDGQWNTSTILPLVDAFFKDNQLNGTEHAWMFLYKGQVMFFDNSTVANIEDLPNDRWTSSRDYTVVIQDGASQSIKYNAELRYFLWFP